MSLPTAESLQGLAFCFDGEPFVQIPATQQVQCMGLGCALDGQPFIATQYGHKGDFFFFF